ncbi:MAG: hypothetical protein AB7I25_08670 [Vicinamibacterales bacterium]
MRYLRFTLLGVVLLAVSSAAATQSTPQPSAPTAAPGSPVQTRTATARQSAPAAQSPAAESSGERANRELHELRQTLWRDVLGQYPASVGRSIQLKPVLISQDDFLSRYPALEAFLKEHPEVRLNQGFFFPALPHEERGGDSSGAVGGLIVATIVPLGFFASVVGIGWFIYQRSRIALQVRQETTTKLIDGLLAREDLVSQLDTPAGRRIIDSLNRQPEPAPAARIIRSVRVGIVLVFGGASFILMQGMFSPGLSSQLVAFGTLTGMVGLGFLASAGVSLVLSRRLGLLHTPDTHE